MVIYYLFSNDIVYQESLTNSLLKHFDKIKFDKLQHEVLKHLNNVILYNACTVN